MGNTQYHPSCKSKRRRTLLPEEVRHISGEEKSFPGLCGSPVAFSTPALDRHF